jgi:hypothetical protein
MTKTFELIEMDPATGTEDHLIETGTFAKLEQEMQELIAEVDAEWGELDVDRYGVLWSVYMIRPAS